MSQMWCSKPAQRNEVCAVRRRRKGLCYSYPWCPTWTGGSSLAESASAQTDAKGTSWSTLGP